MDTWIDQGGYPLVRVGDDGSLTQVPFSYRGEPGGRHRLRRGRCPCSPGRCVGTEVDPLPILLARDLPSGDRWRRRAPTSWSTPGARATTGSPTRRPWSSCWPAGWATWPRWSATTWCPTPGPRPSPGQAPLADLAAPGPGPGRLGRGRPERVVGGARRPRPVRPGGPRRRPARPGPGGADPARPAGPRPRAGIPRHDDGERTPSLRASVLRALGTIGDDPEVQAEAGRRFARRRHGALHPDTESAVLDIVAADGGEPEFEAFLARYRAPANPQEENRYLYALASFRRPGPGRPDLRSGPHRGPHPERPVPRCSCWWPTGSTGPVTWRRITEEWDALVARFPVQHPAPHARRRPGPVQSPGAGRPGHRLRRGPPPARRGPDGGTDPRTTGRQRGLRSAPGQPDWPPPCHRVAWIWSPA